MSADFQVCFMTEGSPILRGTTERPRGVWGVRGARCSLNGSRHSWAPLPWPLSPHSGLSQDSEGTAEGKQGTQTFENQKLT